MANFRTSSLFHYTENKDSLLIVVAHTNYHHDDWVNVHLSNIPERFKTDVTIREIFSTDDHEFVEFEMTEDYEINMFLKASEFKLIEIQLNS